MSDSLNFFNQVGLHSIYDRGVQLSAYLKQKIAARWGQNALWVQYNPNEPDFATFLTAFNPFSGKDDSSQYETIKAVINNIITALAAETPKIYIRSITWRNSITDAADNRIGLRISTHAMYNHYEQIDYLFARLVSHVNNARLPQLS